MSQFRLNPRYRKSTVRYGGVEIKGRVRVVVRSSYSDGSADAVGNDGLSYRIGREAVVAAGLYPLKTGSELLIETGDGEHGDIATSIARA